jgi:hypothetical protein
MGEGNGPASGEATIPEGRALLVSNTTTPAPSQTVEQIPLDVIDTGDNVRSHIDPEHVAALAGSMHFVPVPQGELFGASQV